MGGGEGSPDEGAAAVRFATSEIVGLTIPPSSARIRSVGETRHQEAERVKTR